MATNKKTASTTGTAKGKATAKWLWHADDGWKEYDAKLTARLEEAYRNGDSEVKVDDERLVDLEDMLQRRYDDRMKRRGVKREIPPFLDNEIVLILLTPKPAKQVSALVTDNGGLVASALNKQVTHVVVSEKGKAKHMATLKEAHKMKIPIVNEDYFEECVNDLEVLPAGTFKVSLGDDSEDEEEEEEEEKEKEKEDLDDTQDMDDDPKGKGKATDATKKRKADVLQASPTPVPTTTAAPKPTTTTTTAPAAPLSASAGAQPVQKKARVDDNKNSPSAAADIYIQAKSVFSGVSEQDEFDPFPFMLTITERNDSSFVGTLNWATLSTTTRVRGTISGDELEYEEYEIIIGDDVAIPNNYKAVLGPDGSIKGTFTDSEGGPGNFRLSNTYHVPAPKDAFKANTQWQGVCYTPFPFELAIERRSGNVFHGVVTWPTIDNSKTKVKGTISNDKVEFEEFEVIDGADDVDVPNFFTGALATPTATSTQGVFKGGLQPIEEGSFKMQLKN